MKLLTQLVYDICNVLHKNESFPYITSNFIYDTNYTPEWLIYDLTSQDYNMFWDRQGYCYRYIFDELKEYNLLCISDDNSIYTYDINGISLIYVKKQHPELIVYVLGYTIWIHSDNIFIIIYEKDLRYIENLLCIG